jgi:hypothetical protein
MNRIFKEYPKTYIEFPKGFFRTRKDVSSITGLPSGGFNYWKDAVISESSNSTVAIKHIGGVAFTYSTDDYKQQYFVKYPYIGVIDYGEL